MTRPYGRFFSLPRALAALGHQVELMVVGHAYDPDEIVELAGIRIHCLDVKTLGPYGLYRALVGRAVELQPDWVVACSDMHFGWLARQMAKRSGARLAIDAYDNYEAYMSWNLPLRLLWRRALAAADLVTAAGPQLVDRLQRSREIGSRAAILPMCADDEFYSRDRQAARRELQLPEHSPLVGYLGSWGRRRGTDILIKAFEIVKRSRPDAQLVLTGRPPTSALALPGVMALGYLPDQEIPVLTNALSVACVISDETAFGNFSYPSKLCEAMACSTPVAASATAPIRWMLGENANLAAQLGSAASLAERILAQLDIGKVNYGEQLRWSQIAVKFESLLT